MHGFYLYYIVAVMLVLPVTSIIVESYFFARARDFHSVVEIMAKWFIFWGSGMRSLTAGLSQAFNPAFTAALLETPESCFVAIREIGFANMSIGMTALISLFLPSWRKAAGFCGGLYLGIAGFLHVSRMSGGINESEAIAMISDLFILSIVVIYFICSLKKGKAE